MLKNLLVAGIATSLSVSAFADDSNQNQEMSKPTFVIGTAYSSHSFDMVAGPMLNGQAIEAKASGIDVDAAVMLPDTPVTLFYRGFNGDGTMSDVVTQAGTMDVDFDMKMTQVGASYAVLEQMNPMAGEGVNISVLAGRQITEMTMHMGGMDVATNDEYSTFVGTTLSTGLWRGGWVDTTAVYNIDHKDTSLQVGFNQAVSENVLLTACVSKSSFEHDTNGINGIGVKAGLMVMF